MKIEIEVSSGKSALGRNWCANVHGNGRNLAFSGFGYLAEVLEMAKNAAIELSLQPEENQAAQ